MNCPKCGSDDWKSASLIYKAGATSTSSKTVGGGVSLDGNIVLGGMGSKGQNQTELAKSVAPPEQEEALPSGPATMGCLISVGAAVLLVVFAGDMSISENPSLNFWFPAVFIAVIIFALNALASMKNNPEKIEKYEKAMEEYEKKKVCMRCGNVYISE